jgi:hypothetical protein
LGGWVRYETLYLHIIIYRYNSFTNVVDQRNAFVSSVCAKSPSTKSKPRSPRPLRVNQINMRSKNDQIEAKNSHFLLFFILLVEFYPVLLRFFVDLQVDFLANHLPLSLFVGLQAGIFLLVCRLAGRHFPSCLYACKPTFSFSFVGI